MIVPLLFGDRPVRSGFSGEQRQQKGDAQQLRFTRYDRVSEHLGMGRVDNSIEEEAHADPMLSHGRKIAADLAVAVRNRNRTILIFCGRHTRGFEKAFCALSPCDAAGAREDATTSAIQGSTNFTA